MTQIDFKQGDIAFVQSDADFIAPDGRWYRGAYGEITIIQAAALLGFKPARSADWFVQIGYGANAVVIAGCQLHHAVPFPARCPSNDRVWNAVSGRAG